MTFQLLQPTSLAEACALLDAAPNAAVPLAGGADLLSEIRDGTAWSSTLVALDSIEDAGLVDITENRDGSLRIGALTTIADIAAHDGIRRRYAALDQAAAVCLKRGGDRCFIVHPSTPR